jgi:hypothetical protein
MLDLLKYGLADEWPALASLQAEVRDLELALGKAQGELQAANAAVPTAQQRDSGAASKALRSGKEVPAPRFEPRAVSAVSNAERTVAAYERAVVDATGDLNAFIADHRDALLAAMVEAVNKSDQELAYHAQETARRFAFREDARYDLKGFQPPPPPPDELAPAQPLSTTIIGIKSQRAAGPDRGHVEQVLGYLGSFVSQGGLQDQKEGAA